MKRFLGIFFALVSLVVLFGCKEIPEDEYIYVYEDTTSSNPLIGTWIDEEGLLSVDFYSDKIGSIHSMAHNGFLFDLYECRMGMKDEIWEYEYYGYYYSGGDVFIVDSETHDSIISGYYSSNYVVFDNSNYLYRN
ncbi:MAG: hypothetical protein IJX32_01595 [Spirochaetaceae bacterium]|nr:hypothetical protein [Spirochaetaceae bacterium]